MAIPSYAPIADPRVAVLVEWLTPDEREAFEEAAGIRQYDGGLSQDEAECQALLDVLARHPSGPALRLFRLTLADASSQWVLAHDPAQAMACLEELGGIDAAEEDPAEVLDQQFGGLAFLATAA